MTSSPSLRTHRRRLGRHTVRRAPRHRAAAPRATAARTGLRGSASLLASAAATSGSSGRVSASNSSISASVSSSCSTRARSFSDERPNVTRSNRASRALSASISKRCSMMPARAVDSSVFRAAISAACAAIIACKAATSLGRSAGTIGITRGSTMGPRRTKQNLHATALQPAISGCHVRAGIRQSIPSVSIDSCAGVSDTTPSVVAGQTKCPRSRRLA